MRKNRASECRLRRERRGLLGFDAAASFCSGSWGDEGGSNALKYSLPLTVMPVSALPLIDQFIPLVGAEKQSSLPFGCSSGLSLGEATADSCLAQ